MDFMATGAVVSGGLIMAAGLAGWMLGRSRRGLVRVRPPSACGDEMAEGAAREAPPTPPHTATVDAYPAGATDVTACQHAARAERREVTEAARSLAELHAEITAYRRQEQVLAATLDRGVPLKLAADTRRQECRYLGLVGQPTCSQPHSGHGACTRSDACRSTTRADQSSAPASGFTRT